MAEYPEFMPAWVLICPTGAGGGEYMAPRDQVMVSYRHRDTKNPTV